MSNTTLPFFSVIIPNYNGEKYLSACLDSVLNQTFYDFEIIVVDNFSEDKSAEILEEYIQKDSRVSFYQEHNNGVIAHSRNYGIKKARGEWISTIDSDDIWYPEKLKCVYDIIKSNPKIDVICHYMLMKNMLDGSSTPMVTRPMNKDVYRQLLLYRNMFVQSSMSYKHSFLTDKNLLFDESQDFITVEDYDFSMQIARAGAIFYSIDQYLGEWRVYKTNNSSSPKHIRNFYTLVKKHVYDIQSFEPNKEKLWKRIQAGAVINEANICFNNKRYGRWGRLCLKAIIMSPVQFLSYIFDRLFLTRKRIVFKLSHK